MSPDEDDRRRRRNNILIAVVLGTIAIGVTLLTIFRLSEGDIAR